MPDAPVTINTGGNSGGFNLGQTLGNAGLGLGVQLAGNIVNGLVQNQFDKNTYNRSIGYYNMTRQDALDDWRMQNEYNSPKNQMDRLKQAGISPYAVSGQSIVGANTSQQPRGSNANTPTGYQVNSSINNLMLVQQAKLLEAQIRKTNEETRGNQIINDDNYQHLDEKSTAQIWTAQDQQRLTNATIAEKQQMIENAKAQLTKMNQETGLLKIQEKTYGANLQGANNLQTKSAQLMDKQAQHIQEQINNLDKINKEMLPEQIKEIQQKIKYNQQILENLPKGWEADISRWLGYIMGAKQLAK